jgi:hypothetical protein
MSPGSLSASEYPDRGRAAGAAGDTGKTADDFWPQDGQKTASSPNERPHLEQNFIIMTSVS